MLSILFTILHLPSKISSTQSTVRSPWKLVENFTVGTRNIHRGPAPVIYISLFPYPVPAGPSPLRAVTGHSCAHCNPHETIGCNYEACRIKKTFVSCRRANLQRRETHLYFREYVNRVVSKRTKNRRHGKLVFGSADQRENGTKLLAESFQHQENRFRRVLLRGDLLSRPEADATKSLGQRVMCVWSFVASTL